MNELTILLVMILFPGVLLTVIYDNYAEHKPWDSFKYILYSIVSGIITYSVLQSLIFLGQFLYNIEEFKDTSWHIMSVWGVIKGGKNPVVNPVEILLAGSLSLILGLISVKVTQRKFIHTILIRFGITNKYGDDSVYIKTIETLINDYVTVIVLDEDITIQGIVHCYHDNGGVLEISITDAIVFETSTANELYKTELCYIAKEFGKFMIYKQQEDV